jgi:hypothetical protein
MSRDESETRQGPAWSRPVDAGRFAPGTLLAERYRIVSLAPSFARRTSAALLRIADGNFHCRDASPARAVRLLGLRHRRDRRDQHAADSGSRSWGFRNVLGSQTAFATEEL